MFAHLTKRAALAACALLALGACVLRPTAQDYGQGPALFVARDADSTIYLYGTIHLRRPGEAWGGAHVEDALNHSQRVWTEVDMSPESEARGGQEALRLGRAPDDRPLSSWLTADELARLNAVGGRLGLPEGALEPLRPWLAALTLSVIPMLQGGYDPQAGVDRAIAAWAAEHGRTHRWFETSEEQMGFFAGLSDEAQREMLVQAIDEAGSTAEMVAELSGAWERGDLNALTAQMIADMPAQYPESYEAIFTRRNAAWVEVLLKEMEGEGVDFVAVGVGHLVGDDSVIEMLRARGVRVERIRAR